MAFFFVSFGALLPHFADSATTKPSPKKSPKRVSLTIPERTAFFPDQKSAEKTGTTIVTRYRRVDAKKTDAELERLAQTSTVNIICTIQVRDKEFTSFGTGVVISPDGIVLTNAHVGIYALFPESGTRPNCHARTGSPAQYAFDLEPLYIPFPWVTSYGHRLFDEALTGTGARDYMLLKAKKTATAPLPTAFPFVPFDTALGSIKPKDRVLGHGYAAEFISAEILSRELFASSSFLTVDAAFTFDGDTPDTFSFGGSILARAGISGAPVIDEWGKLVGIMSTATRNKTTADRTLRTISLEYITRDIQTLTTLPLTEHVTQTPTSREVSQKNLTQTKALLRALYE